MFWSVLGIRLLLIHNSVATYSRITQSIQVQERPQVKYMSSKQAHFDIGSSYMSL